MRERFGRIEALDTDARRLLAHLAGLPDAGELPGIDPRSLARGKRIAYVRLLHRALRDGPLVLCVDDLEAADRESLDLLRDALTELRGTSLVVLGTHSPTAKEPWAEWKLRRVDRLELALPPLSPEEVADIVKRSMPGLGRAAVRIITDQADGNPYYTQEIIADLQARSLVEEVDGRWQTDLERLHSVELPATVERVLEGRLLGLAPEQRALLTSAAISAPDGRFWPSMVSVLTGRDEDAIVDGLDQLEAAGLVIPQSILSSALLPEPYTFESQVMRSAAAGMVPLRDAVNMHERAAAWLEARDPGFERSALLAWHHEEAGHTGRAVSAWREAADSARDDQRVADSARCLGSALRAHVRLGPDAREEHAAPLHLLWRLVSELEALGRYQDATAWLDRLAGDISTPGDRFRWHLERGKSLGFAWALEESAPDIDWCTAHMNDSASPADAIAAYAWSAWNAIYEGRPTDADAALAKAAPLVPVGRASPAMQRQLAVLHNARGNAALHSSRLEEAVTEFGACLAFNLALGDRFGEANALGNRGSSRLEAGDLPGARADLEEAVRLSRDVIGNQLHAAMFLSNLAWVALREERPAAARALLDEAATIEVDHPNDALRGELLVRSAACARDLGERERALELVDLARTVTDARLSGGMRETFLAQAQQIEDSL